jgi:hypothetical protein
MSSSLFSSYVPPGVYTDTRVEDNASGPPTGVLLPVVIGTGKEALNRSNYEMVRGSSAQVDQLVNAEDVSGRFVTAQTGDTTFVLGATDGVTKRFQVTRYPMVRGDGSGTTTNRVTDVTVTVNGVAVVPAGVRGDLGLVSLSIPPQAGDEVRVTYRYKRRDTLITEDLSAQISERDALLLGGLSSPFTVEAGVNDLLTITVDGVTFQRTVPAGVGYTATDLATQIQGLGITGLTVGTDTDNLGRERLTFSSPVSLLIGDGSFNGVAGLFTNQRTSRNVVFYVYQGPIVDGSNGGVTTTNPADVTVLVNNQPVVPTAVDGSRRAITLPAAPAAGSTILVTYYFNSWQDTFDDLPDLGVLAVSQVGNVPTKSDYLQDGDWVLQNDRLVWGAATSVAPDLFTAGFDPLDETQVQPMLGDDRIYLDAVTRFVDRALTPPRTSDKVVILNQVPTLGNGRNTPLSQDLFQALSNGRVEVPTNRPDLLAVYTGVDISSAVAAGPKQVVLVEATERRVTLKDPIPPDHSVWATHYYSRLRDDSYTLEVVTQTSGLIPGQLRVTSALTGQLVKDVRFGTLSGSDPVVWPSGVGNRPDAFVISTAAVNETATVTFTQVEASPAVLTAPNTERYSLYAGSSDQLYITADGGATTTNLNQPAPGVLATAPLTAGGSLVFTSANNVFAFELDGTTFTATFPPGSYAGPAVADRIQRAATPLSSATATVAGPYDVLSSVTGTVAGPYDMYANILSTGFGPFDVFAQLTSSVAAPYDIITTQLGTLTGPFDLYSEILGTLTGPFATTGVETTQYLINGVQVDATLTSGAAVPLATVIADLTAAATTAGLVVGPLNIVGNLVEFADDGGALRIRATESVEIGADLDSPSNAILGFTGGDLALAPTDLDLELNGVPVSVVLPGNAAVSTATVVAAIIAEIQSSTTLAVGALNISTNKVNVFSDAGAVRIQATESLEILTGAANPVLGFTDNNLTLSPRDFDVTVNGVAVPTIQVNGGLARSAATLAGELRTGLAVTLTNVGTLSTLTNVADVVVATGGALRLEAKASLLIGSGSLNPVIGLINGANNTAANTLNFTVNGSPVAVTLSGGRSIPSSVIATEMDAAVAAVFPGQVGSLTVLGNVYQTVVTNTQQLDLQATQIMEVTGGSAGAVLGLPVTPAVIAPTAMDIVANGTPIAFNFAGGRQLSASQLRSELEAAATLAGEVGGDLTIPGNTVDAVPTTAGNFRVRALDTLQINAVTDSAYAVLGLTPTALITTLDGLSFTAEGTPFSVVLTHGAGFTASAVASQVDAAAAIAGLTVGPLSTPPNNFDALQITGGFLRVSSLTTLTVGAGTSNPVFGFLAGALPANPVWSRFRAGATSDRFLFRSRVLPTGPSSVSSIRVLSGTANSTLGLTSFQEAVGTERAVNKPATLLGKAVSALNLSTLAVINPQLAFRVNGTDYTASGWGAVTNLADVAVILNAAVGAAGSWTVEGPQLRLTSALSTPDSLVEILPSPATALLGWTGTERSGQRLVTASEVAAVLNWSALSWTAPALGEFPAAAYADAYQPPGTQLRYLRLVTFESGGLRSILLGTGVDDALNDTGFGWEVGQSAVGTDPVDGFVVTSNAGALGSSGTGLVGKTYTDARTGLRFTVLPAADSAYTPGDSFTLIVSDVFLTGNIPTLAMAGTETLLTSTAGVDIASTAILRTFKGTGNEPAVGDFYYVTYDYAKPSLTARRFTQLRDVIAEYGSLDVENPLTLAAFLAFANGAAVVGLKQVLKQPGVSTAASVDYINAIKELERPLEGGVAPDVIIPLTGDATVLNVLKTSCEVQSSIRYRQERRAFVGVASGTRPQDAASLARGLKSERVVLVYPDSAVITLQNALGQNETSLIDGFFLAVALGALACSPQYDVAEPLTRKPLAGFDRLNRFLDETEKNALAIAGVSVLEDANQVVRVRHALTTNVDTVLTAEPTVRAIADYVQQRSRARLDRFIGTKFLTQRAQDVESALTSLLNSLVEANIIKAFRNVEAIPDRNNPTLLRVRAEYAPILPLLYIELLYTIRTNV